MHGQTHERLYPCTCIIKFITMKVLIATEKPFAAAAVEGIRKEIEGAGHELALLEKYTETAQLLDAVKDVDALIIRSDKATAEVFDAAKNLKIVVRAGAGYDNIDLAAQLLKTLQDRTQTQLPNLFWGSLFMVLATSTTVKAVLN